MLNILSCEMDKETVIRDTYHKRYYTIAGITVQVESDTLISSDIFNQKFTQFESASPAPADDVIIIRHHSWLPAIRTSDLGKKVYDTVPWQIYRYQDKWVYARVIPDTKQQEIQSLSIFSDDYGFGEIYHSEKSEFFSSLKSNSLSFLPSDQIILAQALAYRSGCYMHACGIDWKDRGLLFLGESGAGKSTIAKMFQGKAQILCDDRIIIRNHNGTFKIYGTWSHGDIKEIANKGVPLQGIYILSKDVVSRVKAMNQKKEIVKNLFSCLIRPYVTVPWFQKISETISLIAGSASCYRLFFNRSGDIVRLLDKNT